MPNPLTKMTRKKSSINDNKLKLHKTFSTYETKKKETEEIYKKAVELHINEGSSTREIAFRLGVSKSSVGRHLIAFKNGISVESVQPNCGQPKISASSRQFLSQCVARQDRPTSKLLANAFISSKSVEITPRTVRNHLNRMDYKNTIPRRIPLLTELHMQKRYEWCIEWASKFWLEKSMV